MRLWLTLTLVTLLVAVAFDGGWTATHAGIRQAGTFPTNPPTSYFHYHPTGTPHGRILVVHGLDANKEIMNLLCLGLSDAGFEIYSMDMPGHGDSTVGFNAMLARQAVSEALKILGPETMGIGHSLGGALLLDLAGEQSFTSMVLLSPPPISIDRVHAERMLVLTGQFDLPRIPDFVPQLDDAVTGTIERRTIPWSGHSGYLLQPEAIREIVSWLGGDPATLKTGRRLELLWLEILAVIMIPAMWLRGKPIAAESSSVPLRILFYIGCCAVAVLVCGFVVVLSVLRLLSMDYLVSFVFLVGVLQMSSCFRRVSLRFPQIFVSLFAAAGVIAVGAWVGSELVHLTLTGGQWWRFVVIALAVLPLSLADEVMLRPMRPWWKAAGILALTRILAAAFVVLGVLTWNHSDAFLVLVIHFVVLFWIVLWFAGEWLRRQTQDPLATAVFVALIQAWVFAAIFVRI